MKLVIDGQPTEAPWGTSLYDLACASQQNYEHRIAVALVNGRIRELFHLAEEDDEITFLTVGDKVGYEAMRRSICMMFYAAVSSVCGGSDKVILHFSLGEGFYFTLGPNVEVTDGLLEQIDAKMRDLAARRLPILKRSVPTWKARKHFAARGMDDKEKLFRTRIASTVNIYSLDGYDDYFYGAMMHDTDGLDCFRIFRVRDGIALQMLSRVNPTEEVPFRYSEKLLDAQLQGEAFAEEIGIGTVGDLNEKVIAGDAARMILICEALQESRIAEIASAITARPEVRFIMVAGPSSSGKTTFSQRLGVQLSAMGMTPHCISVDNYFVNREDMKPDENGKLDFEALSAVDVEQFNTDMEALLAGERVSMPTFDFIEGKRVYLGDTIKLEEEDILIIEGIHCLNDKLSYRLPGQSVFRIFISALNQLNIDEHNRVPSSDGRLLRRIIRDNRTRGYNAAKTIALWDSVRAGEAKNIFPYQENADVFFNSALPYELAAIKHVVQPLLFGIPEDDPSYIEAKRLLKFLDYFVPLDTAQVPVNSLLREFLGGGCFRL